MSSDISSPPRRLTVLCEEGILAKPILSVAIVTIDPILPFLL